MYQKYIRQMLDSPEEIKLFDIKHDLEREGRMVSQDDLVVARITLTQIKAKDRAFWETIARLEEQV